MAMKEYRTIVVGTDGSSLAAPTVARAGWLAARDDADLVIVCAYAELSRRADAKNLATLGGDSRTGQVLGRAAADEALAAAVAEARGAGAAVSAALLVDGDPARALLSTAEARSAGLLVLGSLRDRSLADRLLGTVATQVAKEASCDVLIVRPEQDSGATELEVPEDMPTGT